MSWIIILFLANAVAHVVSWSMLRKANSPDAMGVLVFAILNAATALLFWQEISWVKWLAIAIPLIGGSALLFTNILKGKGTWIDYVILALDILILVFLVNRYFM